MFRKHRGFIAHLYLQFVYHDVLGLLCHDVQLAGGMEDMEDDVFQRSSIYYALPNTTLHTHLHARTASRKAHPGLQPTTPIP